MSGTEDRIKSVNAILFTGPGIISGGTVEQAGQAAMPEMRTVKSDMVQDMINETHVAGQCGRRQHPLHCQHLHYAQTQTAPGAGQEEPEVMISNVKTQQGQLPGTGQVLYQEALIHQVLPQVTQPAITAYGYHLI